MYLLTGGTDKGLELTPLENTLTGKNRNDIPVKSLYLLDGSATEKIIPALNEKNVKFKGPFKNLTEMLSSLKEEIDAQSTRNEAVVFSPGATSFGMFANEFDRGNKFMQAVKEIFR